MFEHQRKESPIIGLAGMGGGVTSYILYSSASSGGYEVSRSLRFNRDDSAYLNRTPSSAGNRRTWTLSVWCKKTANGIYMPLINANNSSNPYLNLSFTDADKIRWLDGSNQGQVLTDAVFRDNSAWYHVVCATDTTLSTSTDRVKIYVNGVRQDVTFPTTVTQDLQTQVNATTEHRIGRWLGTSTNYLHGYLADYYLIDGQALDPTNFGEFDSNNVWQPKAYSGSYGTNGFSLKFDSYATSADLGTDSSSNNNTWTVNNLSGPGGDVDYASMMTQQSDGGYYANSGPEKSFDGLLTTSANTSASNNNGNITFTPSPSISFTTSVRAYWQHGNTSATYSYNGGSATSITASGWITLASGSGTFTSLNTYRGGDGQYFSAIEVDGTILLTSTGADNDSLIDTPTNYSASGNNGGNYAVLNPIDRGGDSSATLTDGSLKWFGGTTTNHAISRSTLGVSSGKWYVEVLIDDASDTSGRDRVGVVSSEENISISNPVLGNLATGYGYRSDANKENNSTSSSYGATYTTGDIIGIALDMDDGNLVFYKNGVSQGTAYTGLSGTFHFCGTPRENGTYIFNFGQRAFAYTPPTNHLSLCTQNLSDPAISDGSTVFDAKLYTGTGSAQSITGLGFSPDFVWIKDRDNAYTNKLFDTIRGANKVINSENTNAEQTETQLLTSFDSNGFTVGTDGGLNANNADIVSWNWDAGSSTVSNTDGSITSNVRANQTSGFSIVKYSGNLVNGASVGHGLGSEPHMILFKELTSTSAWYVYHRSLGATKELRLNGTNAENSATKFYSTEPTSSVFYLGSDSAVNGSSDDYIAYCYSSVDAYNSFGTYQGNGATDGPFVYTGHRSRFIMIKRTDTTGNWLIYDTARDEVNTATKRLYPDLNNAEGDNSDHALDFLSNGFKIRNGTNANFNANGGTYVYASFSEHPFKTSRAR